MSFVRRNWLFAKPEDKWLASFDLATSAITLLDSHGLVVQKAAALGCVRAQWQYVHHLTVDIG